MARILCGDDISSTRTVTRKYPFPPRVGGGGDSCRFLPLSLINIFGGDNERWRCSLAGLLALLLGDTTSWVLSAWSSSHPPRGPHSFVSIISPPELEDSGPPLC